MNKYSIMEIVEGIVEEADELKGQKELTDIEYGKLLAYASTLSIIQGACSGYDLKEIGLDFDIDKKYLIEGGPKLTE